ncbi:hypothetical protein AXG93_4280s1170 [Marchantia polymorpha subsp. ruderalis]|uniref:Uncharacterized protein n=1 Tax=Marchantia polymorpha subsp. ruderalis TaxID=1480154 RepID=A0A176WLN2_MARPO|nr:hypothetical protein AXG93_4280s1170 [Marchantia polymorpha subsp. ruderalis]
MVLLHVKQNEEQQFLYECAGALLVDEAIRDVVLIHNLSKKIMRLKEQGGQLVLYGPAKDPTRNEDDDSDDDVESPQCSSSVKPRGPFYKRDPANKRTGEACDPEVAERLTQALVDAEACASKVQVVNKVPLTAAVLKESIDLVRGAVKICYPMGLPHYDPVYEELMGAYIGKEFMRENKISDHVGRNEKTKVVVKLQGKGHGAPAREPPIDSETQKAMMAWYYKKQEEQKALSVDEDDTYTNSEWANPKALKSALHRMPRVALK